MSLSLDDALSLVLAAADAGLGQLPRNQESATAAAIARVRRAVAEWYALRPDPYTPPPDPLTSRLLGVARPGVQFEGR